jgi:membrane-associated protein
MGIAHSTKPSPKGPFFLQAIITLISQYGTLVYLLLFGYCALKSGSLPLFGGYAAQVGALDVTVVALATFAGGYLGDELRFAVARRFGAGFLASRPRLSALMSKAEAILDAYGWAYIFIYRYPKGMRTIGALPVGLTQMKWPAFTLLNATSALLWTGLLVGAGYYFGAAIERAVVDSWGAFSIVLLLVFLSLVVLGWRQVSRAVG